VGLSLTGNLLGLSEDEVEALAPEEREAENQIAAARLSQAGAHYVIDGIWDLPDILDDIEFRLADGEQP
jgi:phosphonoacetaldehyde hydrolase